MLKMRNSSVKCNKNENREKFKLENLGVILDVPNFPFIFGLSPLKTHTKQTRIFTFFPHPLP